MQADGSWLDLRDKVCVVTGAAGGLGQAISASFLACGAKIAALDLKTAGVPIAGPPDNCLTVTCDVTDRDSVASAAKQVVSAFGRCDVLVNNAGILGSDPLDSISKDKWNALFEVNVGGYLLCAQEFGRDMLARQSGAIVNIASISGGAPQPFSGAYSAAKAGVAMLSRQLAVEWGPRGVRSNSVSPGMIHTALTDHFYAAEGIRERRERMIPMRRLGRPEDVANAVLFLASSRCGYVNGVDLLVDGGLAQSLIGMIPRASDR